jgi:hypothetical protein
MDHRPAKRPAKKKADDGNSAKSRHEPDLD